MKRFLSAFGGYLRRSDTFLLALCLICTVFGSVLIASALRADGNMRPLYVQIGAAVLGLVLYFLFSLVDIDLIADKWRLLTFLGLALILSLRWLGSAQGGNRAWIRFAGIGIQPAELVKVVFIVSMAHLITHFADEERLNSPLSLAALLLYAGVFFALIVVVSGDTGSALVYLFIFVVMLYAAGLSVWWILGAVGVLLLTVPYIWYYFLTDNYRNRILATFIPAQIDPTGQGITWQTRLAKAAIASGGVLGQGLFHGPQTATGDLPLQSSDFIFAVAGEETGILGCLLIVTLLTLIIVRVVQVGLRSKSRLGALTCMGVAAMVAVQTLENVGMCIGIAPVIGLTLPFFSYGGSSIVTLYAAMGIVSGIKMKPKPTMFLR